jgi:hypothetical protein
MTKREIAKNKRQKFKAKEAYVAEELDRYISNLEEEPSEKQLEDMIGQIILNMNVNDEMSFVLSNAKANGPKFNDDGDLFHFKDGDLHKEDGPAVIYYDDKGNVLDKEYWLNGEKIECASDKEYKKLVSLKTYW